MFHNKIGNKLISDIKNWQEFHRIAHIIVRQTGNLALSKSLTCIKTLKNVQQPFWLLNSVYWNKSIGNNSLLSLFQNIPFSPLLRYKKKLDTFRCTRWCFDIPVQHENDYHGKVDIHHFTVTFLKLIYLKGGKRERQILSDGSFLRCLQQPRLGLATAKSKESHSGLPHNWQEHNHLPPRVHKTRNLELVTDPDPIGNADVPSSGLTAKPNACSVITCLLCVCMPRILKIYCLRKPQVYNGLISVVITVLYTRYRTHLS